MLLLKTHLTFRVRLEQAGLVAAVAAATAAAKATAALGRATDFGQHARLDITSFV